MRREFEIDETGEFLVKLINEHGHCLELSEINWEQLRSLHAEQSVDRQNQAARVQLEIELLEPGAMDDIDDDASNYEDEFEDEAEPSERAPAFRDAVTKSEV